MAKGATRRVSIYINEKEIEASIKDVRKEYAKLNAQQDKLIMGSEKYNIQAKKIRELKKIITEHNEAVGKTSTTWERLNEKIMKFGAGMGGFSMLFQTIDAGISKLKNLATEVAEIDDVYSDVQKTTGMTRDQVLDLNESFKNMDTRTAREELNKYAYIAGKLGIEQEDLVLQFVDGANIISVALSDALGEDAIELIGKIVNVYTKSTDILKGKSLKEQMLSVGSGLNVIGQTSSANEQYVVNFMGRLGGLATQAKIAGNDIMGYASALDQDMNAVELSATAFQKLIKAIMTEPKKFAKIAGMEVKAFNKLIETDMNQAILKVLQGFAGKGGMSKLLPFFKDLGLDAERATQAISSMANSVDKIILAQEQAKQAMIDGTSVINEYNIKNNNMQAELEKSRKAFRDKRMELGEKLYPVLLQVTKSSTELIKGIGGLFRVMSENKSLVVALSVLYGGYLARLLYVSLAKKGLISNTVLLSKVQAIQSVVVESLKLRYYTLTGNTLLAAKAQDALSASMAKVPWVAIAAAILIAGNALWKYLNRQTELQKSMSDFYKESEKQTFQAKELFERLKKLKSGTEEYNKVQKQIIDTYPDILKNQVDEKGNLKDLELAYKSVTMSIEANIAAKLQKDAIDKILESSIDSQISSLNKFDVAFRSKIKRMAEEGKTAQQIMNELNLSLKTPIVQSRTESMSIVSGDQIINSNVEVLTEEYKALLNIVDVSKKTKKEIDEVRMSFSPFIDDQSLKDIREIEEQIKKLNFQLSNTDNKDEKNEIRNQIKLLKEKKQLLKNPEVTPVDPTPPEPDEDIQKKWDEFLKNLEKLKEDARINEYKDLDKEKETIKRKYDDQIKIAQEFASQGIAEAKNKIVDLEKLRNDEIKLADQNFREKGLENHKKNLEKLTETIISLESKIGGSFNNKYANELIDSRNKWDKIIDDIDDSINYYLDKKDELYDPILGTGLSDDEIKLLEKLLENKKVAIENSSKEELDIVKRAEKDITYTLLNEKEKQIRDVEDYYNDKIAIAQTAIEELKKVESEENKSRIAELEKQIKELKAKLKIDIEKVNNGDQSILSKLFGTKGDWDAIKALWKENWREILDETQNFANNVEDMFSNIYDIQSNKETSALNEYQKNIDTKKEDLDRMLKQGIISQTYYNSTISNMDKELSLKQKQLELDKFRREKRASISKAIISGILAAIESFKNGGGMPYGLIPAGLSAAFTGAQIAAIASEPEPYATGGFIGNEKIIRIAEQGPEWVASNPLLKNKKTSKIIAALDAYQNGNKSMLNNLYFPQPNSSSMSLATRSLNRNFESQTLKKETIQNYYIDNEKLTLIYEKLDLLTVYLSDPKNRQTTVSRKILLEFENDEQFLRNKAKL